MGAVAEERPHNKTLDFVSAFLSFETFYTLFLFAGRFKADPRFSSIPVDLTLLFFVFSFFLGTYIVIRRRFRINAGALFLFSAASGFFIWVMVSFCWTPGSVYALQKMARIIPITLWSFLATAFIISPDSRRVKRFLWCLVVFAVWIALETIKADAVFGQRVISVLGGNYLGVGRTVGPAIIIVFVYMLFEKKIFNKILLFSAFIIFLSALLVARGRGPFLATLAAFMVPILLSMGMKADRKYQLKFFFKSYALPAILLYLSIAMIVGYLFISGHLTSTMQRFVLFFTKLGASADVRLFDYQTSWTLFEKNPVVGYGIGSWPLLAGFPDMRGYPHNIILEILVEMGMVGAFFFFIFLFAGVTRLLSEKISNNPQRMIILALFVNAFVNAMLSGDIPDNRFLFSVVGLMCLNSRNPE